MTLFRRVLSSKKPMKQVILVRVDVKMGKGKLAAQVAHAAVSAAFHAQKKKPEWLKAWLDQGQKKVVVKVENEARLREFYGHGVELGLPCSLIQDAGHTQLEPGTTTTVGLGPAPEHVLTELTGELKLL